VGVFDGESDWGVFWECTREYREDLCEPAGCLQPWGTIFIWGMILIGVGLPSNLHCLGEDAEMPGGAVDEIEGGRR